MINLKWAGEGYCQARSIRSSNDWCNQPVIKNGKFCEKCTCIIYRCKEKQVVSYPLLFGEPRFCGKHRKPKYAEKFGCDFSGPDDFDIPIADDIYQELEFD